MKLTTKQLKEAAAVAEDIERLEALRDAAIDSEVIVNVGNREPSAQNPLGQSPAAVLESLQNLSFKRVADTGVVVTVPATTIRAALVDRLAPLYTRLRNMGIELQR